MGLPLRCSALQIIPRLQLGFLSFDAEMIVVNIFFETTLSRL